MFSTFCVERCRKCLSCHFRCGISLYLHDLPDFARFCQATAEALGCCDQRRKLKTLRPLCTQLPLSCTLRQHWLAFVSPAFTFHFERGKWGKIRKICMFCLVHVLFMSCSCLVHVLFMSCSCLVHVLFMSCSCLVHVLFCLLPFFAIFCQVPLCHYVPLFGVFEVLQLFMEASAFNCFPQFFSVHTHWIALQPWHGWSHWSAVVQLIFLVPCRKCLTW